MKFRKYNFFIHIGYFLFFNIIFFQSFKASEIINNQLPQNNKEEKSNSFLQEDYYIIGSGDLIKLTIVGVPELNTTTKVLNDGNAIIPLLGPVKIRGLTVLGASKYIENLYSKELINPKVELFLSENRPIKIAVIGEVSRPGIYKLNSATNDLPTVVTAIEEAGGISKFADLTNIKLSRQLPGEVQSYKETNLNFRNLLFKGDQSQNPYLFDGDIVELKKVKNSEKDFLPITSTSLSPKFINVNFLGEIERPGTLKLDANTTLVDGILAAGGPKSWRSNYGNVEILRMNRNGSAFRKRYKIDLSQNYSEKNNPILNNGDSVWLRSNSFAKASDTLSLISKPFRDIVNLWAMFKLID